MLLLHLEQYVVTTISETSFLFILLVISCSVRQKCSFEKFSFLVVIHPLISLGFYLLLEDSKLRIVSTVKAVSMFHYQMGCRA